jgi:hypothetical protein
VKGSDPLTVNQKVNTVVFTVVSPLCALRHFKETY